MRCCPLPPTSNFGFLHLSVVQKGSVYSCNGSIAPRHQRGWVAAKLPSPARAEHAEHASRTGIAGFTPYLL